MGTELTTAKNYDGSRRHVLDLIESSPFLDMVRQWTAPQGFTITPDALVMPKQWTNPRESRLFDTGSPFLDSVRKDTMHRWWLQHAGNIPNWDLIVRANGPLGPALILVEAKAHSGELDRKRKPRSVRALPEDQARTDDNHRHIGLAIAEASQALAAVNPSIRIGRDHHYQLSNRIAMAWKLASLGIPNTLVFLGFTGDQEIGSKGAHFSDMAHWNQVFEDYIAGIFPKALLDSDISAGAASFRVISRTLPILRSSRSLPERKQDRPRQ